MRRAEEEGLHMQTSFDRRGRSLLVGAGEPEEEDSQGSLREWQDFPGSPSRGPSPIPPADAAAWQISSEAKKSPPRCVFTPLGACLRLR
eukprot:9343184-Pyramimonas_sp.AAC.1